MKIIILGNWEGLKNRPDKLDYNFFYFLKKNTKYNVILCETVESEVKKIIDINDIIIVFTCEPNVISLKNKKIFYMYDVVCTCKYDCKGDTSMCGFKNQLNFIKNQNIDHVWYKYENLLTKTLKNNQNNCYKFPHMIFDKNIHKDYNLEKKYDILFYGNTIKESYPFRYRLLNLLKKNTHKFNILFLPYNKRREPEKIISGIDLYKLISQSWITCACSAISNCLLAKYFEIGLCGSVVLGDYPEYENEVYLKENMIYINRHMSDEDILNCITKALNNKKMLLKYSNNTKQYFSKKYMYENGLQRFEELISFI
jgi:hypothetical protein